ncbi:unnamed protein product [Dibothriocephalus latus]|uniref:Laminin G domain-containing protein n=1 Tax=Dibothriocephalus latus TaxID=60516 RepID=A0A3P7R1M2_DIBLA|nr:unnamed protein product [Dibothriocephalus latus]
MAEDLPVWEVRFGDTGGLNDNKKAEYSVQELRCLGDRLFDNTVTFVKEDANIELPLIYAEFEFDMSFLFKTTVTDAVLMQNVGRKSGHFFELRIRSGFAFRFAFNVGNGLQVLEVVTAYWLNNNQWHVVRLERNRKESRLIVDSNPARVLVEPDQRSYQRFDFDQPLFVGTTQVSSQAVYLISYFFPDYLLSKPRNIRQPDVIGDFNCLCLTLVDYETLTVFSQLRAIA